jgi:hypothetical protein
VDFQFGDHNLRGLEQNPETGSRWPQLARQGKKSCSFFINGAASPLSLMAECSFMGIMPDHLITSVPLAARRVVRTIAVASGQRESATNKCLSTVRTPKNGNV